jgi:hypothetical protein
MVDVATRDRNGRSPTPDGDWPSQAADTIERVVGTVRDRTTKPALTVARAIVYGTFAVVVGITALVLAAISLVRIVDVYLPEDVFGEENTWFAHLVVGLPFVVAGLFLWSRRRARSEPVEQTGSS